MRVATFNIRNGRALDRSSWWWRRRAGLLKVMEAVDADVWGLQEAYPMQIGYARRRGFDSPEWSCVGRGRNRNGGGEAAPVFAKTALVTATGDETRWFGPTPELPGSRSPGASHPRVATIARYVQESGSLLTVVNLHLDPASVERRRDSLVQLAEWLGAEVTNEATIVLGDFNGPLDEPGFGALRSLGLRSVLDEDAGPTSNGFGRGLASQQQIDHIFVSRHFEVQSAYVDRSAGHASDHYPVVADLEI